MALTDSLISHWKLNESSGNALDAHGSNNLTDTNTVTSAAGKINTSRQFTNANSEYFTIADNASLSTGDIDFTISCWVYLDSKTGNRVFIARNGGSYNYEYILKYRQSTDRFFFQTSNGVNTEAFATANNFGSPSTGIWYFIVAWHDSVANTVNISINDGTVDSAADVAITDRNVPTTMGYDNVAAADDMDGRIDECSFWKRVLTAQERTNLYNNGLGLPYPFLPLGKIYQFNQSIKRSNEW